ncbi:MAG: hypothetical protein V5B40_06535 [Candidatus Accumulibacter meliphilus]|uniref:hypothetical protein n=1 Tax=Candidatus Accumulibacter meliphilus TaxID=2211374 RepID=UPI002FC3D841
MYEYGFPSVAITAILLLVTQSMWFSIWSLRNIDRHGSKQQALANSIVGALLAFAGPTATYSTGARTSASFCSILACGIAPAIRSPSAKKIVGVCYVLR